MYNVKFVVPFNLIKRESLFLVSIHFKLTFSQISAISLLSPLSFGFTIGLANDFGKLGINRVSYIYIYRVYKAYIYPRGRCFMQYGFSARAHIVYSSPSKGTLGTNRSTRRGGDRMENNNFFIYRARHLPRYISATGYTIKLRQRGGRQRRASPSSYIAFYFIFARR